MKPLLLVLTLALALGCATTTDLITDTPGREVLKDLPLTDRNLHSLSVDHGNRVVEWYRDGWDSSLSSGGLVPWWSAGASTAEHCPKSPRPICGNRWASAPSPGAGVRMVRCSPLPVWGCGPRISPSWALGTAWAGGPGPFDSDRQPTVGRPRWATAARGSSWCRTSSWSWFSPPGTTVTPPSRPGKPACLASLGGHAFGGGGSVFSSSRPCSQVIPKTFWNWVRDRETRSVG